jgi:hypothetical protein
LADNASKYLRTTASGPGDSTIEQSFHEFVAIAR